MALQDRKGMPLTVESKMFSGVEGVTTDRVSAEEYAAVLLAYWTGEQHAPDERLERKFNSLIPVLTCPIQQLEIVAKREKSL